jgi:hypothetical protein
MIMIHAQPFVIRPVPVLQTLTLSGAGVVTRTSGSEPARPQQVLAGGGLTGLLANH